ncbi:exo-alpha-sialidase [Bacillus sp. FJAT-49711]|uniref:WD40/YVTN/BNR-like repeat-containing protein n=1 Tax=Bacillus sp. FJAT-49711 TaxID=2833585 RepID=UPI001BCA561A|nr:sialidase family protein [Bacillus sp. FJAT-49711]MBS4219921.1 exo-alpha-sialidase [Bacillus sp. FJAT-49711]
MKLTQKRLGIIIVLFLIVVVSFMLFYPKNEEKPIESLPINEFGENEVNQKLPLTLEVGEDDKKPETIAYRLWFDLIQSFKDEGLIENAYFKRFHFLEGDENDFVVAVVYQVEPRENTHTSFGEVNEEGLVDNIVWKLRIRKDSRLIYTLESFEKSTDTLIGLPPVQDEESYQKEAGIEPHEDFRYEIANEMLKITYDNGKGWVEVPATMEELFGGDYSGSKEDLIDGSYIINPQKTAFVLVSGEEMYLLMTMDQGKTWNKVLIKDQLPSVRQRFIGFTSEKDGYLIFTCDRTMSFEANFVMKTHDGGKTWEMAGLVEETQRLVTSGGFINDMLGFISFGTVNVMDEPPRPSLYRTDDGGGNWEEVEVPIPDEYKEIFTIAEIPVFKDGHGTLIVNQGPNGDYLGGKVLAKYTSEDEGKTWVFSSLIDPNNVLGEER